ncbi:hypothetical protein AKJ53_01875 [candidate division MSBL1 archaeon SCGC-AAA382F02]|uniref:Phosphoglucosamine mutase n=1 Tax=candidate division MSBL1 archaeon SCGC-AAA382F02 TaxID=1698282 RepID=A0A133VHE0_9EURY|nr:hypothetical protein AKJ53_01875 [candidate division MSBL1 archaeon SCGC-AAA382F02]
MPGLFGTFGIRGIANKEFSPDLAYELGLALATQLGNEGKVAIGYDIRTSSPMLEHALTSGITSGGCDAVRLGMVPTPVLSFGTKHFSCDAGVMITASHNPPEYNGMKFWDEEGAGFVREREDELEQILEEGGKSVEWDEIGKSEERDAISPYREAILEKIPKFDREMKVIIDCANGAGSNLYPQILKELGCEVVSINNEPDGHFPGRPPEPTPEHIKELSEMVSSSDADLGIAHDGDADRTIIVDENGKSLSGDRVFALAAINYLREKENPRIITTVATSSVLDDAAEKLGGEVVRTKVGEPELIREFRKNGGDLAGEENGGVIFPDWVYCREGLMTDIQFIDYIARTEKTVSELDKTLPEYKQLKKKTDCPEELKPKVLEDLSQKLSDYNPDRTDGIRVVFDDGWYILRPSGTEPIFRCFSEAKTEERAEELADEGMKFLKESLKSVKQEN